MDLAQIVKGANLKLVEVGDWRNHQRPYPFNPVGVMVHHTAGPLGGNAPSLNTCIHGVPKVPGPLANFLVGRDGTIFLISDGYVNGSGVGNKSVLDRVKVGLPPTGNATSGGTIVGNEYFYNIEVENNGVGEPYPSVQIDALVRLSAALCRAHKWSQNRVIHHREWTNRKIDMSWQGPLRESVAAHLVAPPPVEKPDPKPHPPIVKKISLRDAAYIRIHIPNKAYGAGDVWVNAEEILGREPRAIIGLVVRGPYPPKDGWELERAEVNVRAKLAQKREGGPTGVIVTMTGCKDPDGCEVLLTVT